eukprot:2630735-Rhodomonas_salina.1
MNAAKEAAKLEEMNKKTRCCPTIWSSVPVHCVAISLRASSSTKSRYLPALRPYTLVKSAAFSLCYFPMAPPCEPVPIVSMALRASYALSGTHLRHALYQVSFAGEEVLLIVLRLPDALSGTDLGASVYGCSAAVYGCSAAVCGGDIAAMYGLSLIHISEPTRPRLI